MKADGTRDHALPMAPGAVWDGRPVWSNDGTRLAIMRGYGPIFERSVVAVVPADEGGLGVETDPSLLAGWEGIPDLEWAPDDSSILLTRIRRERPMPTQQVLIDPLTGEFHETPWKTVSRPAWQRVRRDRRTPRRPRLVSSGSRLDLCPGVLERQRPVEHELARLASRDLPRSSRDARTGPSRRAAAPASDGSTNAPVTTVSEFGLRSASRSSLAPGSGRV